MGSISEVWAWLIHVPVLGWIVFGVVAVVVLAFVAYAVAEFRKGADPGRPGW